MQDSATFWDKIARRYAADPVKDQKSYEDTLARIRRHLRSGDHVLEIGCGTGSTALILAGAVSSYDGTDISKGMIEIAQEKLALAPVEGLVFRVASLEDAPQGRLYDVIIGSSLLHLLPGPEAAIMTLHAALKPGGLLITKSVCLKGRGFHLRVLIGAMRAIGKAPYVGFHRASDFGTMMRNAGFNLLETTNIPTRSMNHFIVARRA